MGEEKVRHIGEMYFQQSQKIAGDVFALPKVRPPRPILTKNPKENKIHSLDFQLIVADRSAGDCR
jgi:hypothetical protein